MTASALPSRKTALAARRIAGYGIYAGEDDLPAGCFLFEPALVLAACPRRATLQGAMVFPFSPVRRQDILSAIPRTSPIRSAEAYRTRPNLK
jgi:hypothetical protein